MSPRHREKNPNVIARIIDSRRPLPQGAPVRLIDLQIIGTELAVRWDDNTETFVPLELLRQRCPCAACQGETDVMGQLHKGPPIPLTTESFRLVRISPVGGYGLQPLWGDGHATGIYSFDYLRRLAPQP